MQDALGVVEPVHAEQHGLRLAQHLADLLGPGLHLGALGDLAEAPGVDRDRERGGTHAAAPGAAPGGEPPPAAGVVGQRDVRHPDIRPVRGQPGAAAAGPEEVGRVALPLEAEQVRAEQALHDLLAPGQLGEDLVARERDVREMADPHVAAQRADHPGHQLQLVVVHPDGRALGRLGGDRVRVPAVHPDVGIPPLPVEFGWHDHVVVQRPQRGVAEALVVVPHLGGGQAHADQVHAVDVERLGWVAGRAGPADPGPVGRAHHRFQRGDQAAGAGPPLGLPIRPLGPVDGQPAGGDDEVVLAGLTRCGPVVPGAASAS